MGAQQNAVDGLQQQSLLLEMEGYQVVTAQLHMFIRPCFKIRIAGSLFSQLIPAEILDAREQIG